MFNVVVNSVPTGGWTSMMGFYPAMGLLPDTKDCGLCMRRECWERFTLHRELAIPTYITARGRRDGSLNWSRWRRKRSRHSRRMRNPQLYVSL